MSVRWTKKAFADLDAIYEVIVDDRLVAAKRILRTLLSCGEGLSRYPRRARPGRLPETREWVVSRIPYIIVHELRVSHVSAKPDVLILRVIHGATHWPPESRPSLGFNL